MEIRIMEPGDYGEAMVLWNGAAGVGISPDDTEDNIRKYLVRNPQSSFVAVEDNKIVGAIMAGHDGYRGFIHHTAVAEEYRKHGIGKKLMDASMKAIKDEGINKVVLVVFKKNEIGNSFWEKEGFEIRNDLNYRNLRIREE